MHVLSICRPVFPSGSQMSPVRCHHSVQLHTRKWLRCGSSLDVRSHSGVGSLQRRILRCGLSTDRWLTGHVLANERSILGELTAYKKVCKSISYRQLKSTFQNRNCNGNQSTQITFSNIRKQNRIPHWRKAARNKNGKNFLLYRTANSHDVE